MDGEEDEMLNDEVPLPRSPALKREWSEDDISLDPEAPQTTKRQRLSSEARLQATSEHKEDETLPEQLNMQTNDDRALSHVTEANHGRGSEVPLPRSEPPDERALERHHSYFYEDGSVVLQLENTLFRLHKTLLSVQSTFFREMFADADHEAEWFDDDGVVLPLYVLSIKGLHVADFERLLEIMENPLLISRAAESPSLDFVSSVVLAAHLLKFDVIHAWAAEELHGYWPSKLDNISTEPDDWILCVEYASAALQLSRDANVSRIYKGAFYELLRRENFGQDGVPLLGSADYDLLTRARQLCASIWMETISIPLPRSKKCRDDEKESGERSACVMRRKEMLVYKWGCIVESTKARDRWIDPVAGFRMLEHMELPHEEKGGLCAACFDSWRGIWKKKRIEFWDKLDEILGLVVAAEV